MVKTPEVVDYQVHQTRCGVDVFVVAAAGSHMAGLTDRLARALVAGGLRRPKVVVRTVDRLDRHPVTGKLRRFIPLTTA
jgi:phenylacetate-CoA ligase